jgi:hypothetical protein
MAPVKTNRDGRDIPKETPDKSQRQKNKGNPAQPPHARPKLNAVPSIPNPHTLIHQITQRRSWLDQLFINHVCHARQIPRRALEPFLLGVFFRVCQVDHLKLQVRHRALVQRDELLELQPEGRVRPEFGGAGFVCGILIDFVFENVDMFWYCGLAFAWFSNCSCSGQ